MVMESGETGKTISTPTSCRPEACSMACTCGWEEGGWGVEERGGEEVRREGREEVGSRGG